MPIFSCISRSNLSSSWITITSHWPPSRSLVVSASTLSDNWVRTDDPINCHSKQKWHTQLNLHEQQDKHLPSRLDVRNVSENLHIIQKCQSTHKYYSWNTGKKSSKSWFMTSHCYWTWTQSFLSHFLRFEQFLRVSSLNWGEKVTENPRNRKIDVILRVF